MQYPESDVVVAKTPMLPWILFVLVLLGGVGGVLVQKQKLDFAMARIANAQSSEEKARAELAEVASARKAAEIRAQDLQVENGRLSAKVAAVAARAAEPVKPAKATQATKKARSKHHKHR